MNPTPARRATVVALALAIAAVLAVPARAQSPESGDRTLSPFFFVPGGDPAIDRLPLKSTSAAVRIAGVVADVTVTQVYANAGTRPIEAIYVFPASTRAAVHGMTMRIGGRTITAVIQERGQARRTYEDAKRQGRSASLLEQQRPNVFQMNVANVMPGDEIRVELEYSELLVPEDGVYEFVYPTVVGPRYTTTPAAGAPDAERWTANPYHRQGEPPAMTFDFTAAIVAGMPLDRVACPTHRTRIDFDGPAAARVSLDPGERAGATRDVILRYALAGAQVDSGLVIERGRDESFFLLTVQPPRRVAAAQIVPREYVFVVDVSGSMHGFPLDTSKALLRDLIGRLRPSDTFNVVLFAGAAAALAEHSLPANATNVARAVQFIDAQQGGGGTELLPALRRALALPRSEGTSRTVVIATDGYVAVEKEAFELVRTSLGRANFFAFGIGSAVNRFLIEGLARAGQGEAFVVTKPEEAGRQAARFRTMIEAPVLTGVEVEFQGFDAYDVEPPQVPDVLAERPVVLVGKFRGEPRGRIVVRGAAAIGRWSDAFDVRASRPEGTNGALRTLWARQRIAALADFAKLEPNSEKVREVTSLGLTYSLLTDYTSFVAVDSRVRTHAGDATTVTQPLPLPDGVSNLAVGGALAMQACAAPAPYRSADAVREEVGRVAKGKERGSVNDGMPGGDAEVRGDAAATPADAVLAALGARVGAWTFAAATAPTTVTVTLRRAGEGAPSIVEISATGALSIDQVRAAIRRHLATLGQVWPAGASAAITLRFTVRPDGSVTSVHVAGARA